eukprot:SAG22_NODE_5554_length_993_cov_6.309843_1_plen_56_part_10
MPEPVFSGVGMLRLPKCGTEDLRVTKTGGFIWILFNSYIKFICKFICIQLNICEST